MKSGKLEQNTKVKSVLNADALENIKKTGFTGFLEVEWENGAIKNFNLISSISFGRRTKDRHGSFDDCF